MVTSYNLIQDLGSFGIYTESELFEVKVLINFFVTGGVFRRAGTDVTVGCRVNSSESCYSCFLLLCYDY